MAGLIPTITKMWLDPQNEETKELADRLWETLSAENEAFFTRTNTTKMDLLKEVKESVDPGWEQRQQQQLMLQALEQENIQLKQETSQLQQRCSDLESQHAETYDWGVGIENRVGQLEERVGQLEEQVEQLDDRTRLNGHMCSQLATGYDAGAGFLAYQVGDALRRIERLEAADDER